MFINADIDFYSNYPAYDALDIYGICYENTQYDSHSVYHKSFTFLKHGETDWTKELLHLGPMSLPLNTSGFAQSEIAANLMKKLDISMIIASPTIRCIQTAEVVAGFLKNPTVLIANEIEERYFGDWSKQIKAAKMVVENSTKGTGFFRSIGQKIEELLPNDAEKKNGFDTRVVQAVNKYLSRYSMENLLIVAHGGVMAVLAKAMNIPMSKVDINKYAMPMSLTHDEQGLWHISLLDEK